MELNISTSLRAAVPRIVVGAVFAVLGFNYIGSAADQGQFGSIIELAFQAGPIIIMIAGLGLFARGAIMLADRRTARFEGGQVTVTGRSFLRSESWSEALSAYEGVRWREIVVRRWTGLSNNTSSNNRPSVYQVLELQHPDPARCIPLYVTRLRAGAHQKLENLAKLLKRSAKDGSHPKFEDFEKLDGLPAEDRVRQNWEHFSKLLGVPTIDTRGEKQQVRAAADVDKSIRELADEGKIHAEWDGRPPPAGLEVIDEGDADDPDAQAILVTIRAKKYPVWVYGAILAFCGFFFIMGVVDLALIAVLFGGGIGAGVIWHWKSEERNPRTIRITRTQLLIDTTNPGNATQHDVIDHRAIESVKVSGQYDRTVMGSQLAIATDQEEYKVGAGLSKDGLAWLRDLILSAVAKA
jgi:hypothetical protein